MKYKDPTTGDFKELKIRATDELPVGSEIDVDDNTTIPAGWEEVDDPNVYSTTEKVIGEFLGKPLYRRVYEGTTANVASGEVTTSMTIDNVDKVVKWSGWIQGSDVPYTLPAPNSRLIKISNTSIRLDFINQGTSTQYARKSYILCVEYIKTTD